jgi:hypothetical protein
MKKRLEFTYCEDANRITIKCRAECGKEFDYVAFIYDPMSKTPGMMIPRVLGIWAVVAIMNGLERWREEPTAHFIWTY